MKKTSLACVLLISSLFSFRALACEEDAQAGQAADTQGKPTLSLAQASGEKAVFKIKGMSCKSCEKAISAALQKVDGVKGVTFQKKNAEGLRLAEVTLAAGSKVSPDQLVKAIEGAGYHATTTQ